MPPDRKAEARGRSPRATTRSLRPSRAQLQARQAACQSPGAGMNLASSGRGGTHGHFRPTQRWRIRRASHLPSSPSPSRGCAAESVPTTRARPGLHARSRDRPVRRRPGSRARRRRCHQRTRLSRPQRLTGPAQNSVVHAEVAPEAEPHAADASRKLLRSGLIRGHCARSSDLESRAWLCLDAIGDGSAIGFGSLNPAERSSPSQFSSASRKSCSYAPKVTGRVAHPPSS